MFVGFELISEYRAALLLGRPLREGPDLGHFQIGGSTPNSLESFGNLGEVDWKNLRRSRRRACTGGVPPRAG